MNASAWKLACLVGLFVLAGCQHGFRQVGTRTTSQEMYLLIWPAAGSLTLVDESDHVDWSEVGSYDVIVESTYFENNGAGFQRMTARIGSVSTRLRPLATDEELYRLWLRGDAPKWMSVPDREFFEIAQDGVSGYWPSYVDVVVRNDELMPHNE